MEGRSPTGRREGGKLEAPTAPTISAVRVVPERTTTRGVYQNIVKRSERGSQGRRTVKEKEKEKKAKAYCHRR